MKFACDSCHAQYLISDDKVGPNGVIVRCKKCQNKIVVRRPATPPSAEEPKAPPAAPDSEPASAADSPSSPGADGQAPAPISEPSSGAPMAAAAVPMPAPAVGEISGIDDELGRAFDSVLARPGGLGESAAPQNGSGGAHDFALAAAAARGDEDLESTTVVDLRPMASLIRPEIESEKPNGAGAADATAAEWFVAINDAQTGPLTLDGVRTHWDKGELSGDSLVWRAGLPDWRPLSTVPELAEALAPVPKPPTASERAEAPAGAIATGVQAPVTSALPPPQGAPTEPTWKPSAASALESLVKQELEALQKPPEKRPEPAPAAPEVAAQSNGLIDELPPAGDEPARPERAQESALPRRAPVEHDEDGGEPGARPSGPFARPRSEPAEEVRGARPAAAPRKRSSMLMGVIIGIVLITGVAATVGALFWFNVISRPQPPAPVAVAPAQPAPAPTAVTASAAPVAQAPAQTPVAVASAAPEGAGQPEKAPVPAESAASRPAAAPAAASAKQHAPKGATAAAPASATATKEPEAVVEAPAPRARPSGSSIDDEFNRMFGSNGGAAAAEPAAKKDKPKSTPYIPPAPGAGAGGARESLGRGDVMEVVLANRAAIKKCTDASGGSGTVAMRWTIRQDGNTTGVQTLTPDFQKTPLATCLTSVIKSFKFPAYSGAPMEPIDFPFKF